TLQDLNHQEVIGNPLSQLIEAEADLGDHVTGGVIRSWLKDKLMLAQLEIELEGSQHLVKLQQQLLQRSGLGFRPSGRSSIVRGRTLKGRGSPSPTRPSD
ncbi:hypothetical protein CRUP_002983, partial [Coryphaenoides rupestris]